MKIEKITKEDAEKARVERRKKLKTQDLESLTEEELNVLLSDVIHEVTVRSDRRHVSPGRLFQVHRRVER